MSTDFSRPGTVVISYARFVRSDDKNPTRAGERIDVSVEGGMDRARDRAKALAGFDSTTYVVVDVLDWHDNKIASHKWTRRNGWITL